MDRITNDYNGTDTVALLPPPEKEHIRLTRLAASMRTLGCLHDARELLLQALKLQPRDPSVWTHLGAVLTDLGMRDAAKNALRHGCMYSATNTVARMRLAVLLAEDGEHGDALECLEQVCRSHSSLSSAWLLRGRCHAALGEDRQAAECERRARMLGADTTDLVEHLARRHREAHRSRSTGRRGPSSALIGLVLPLVLTVSLTACRLPVGPHGESSYCGDGTCEDGIETCDSCAADCGSCAATCGDGACDEAAGESCSSCEADCGACPAVCGDSTCDTTAGETCATCEADCGVCGAVCGDGTCDEAVEDCSSCPADCGGCAPYCGDGTCSSGLETCDSCAVDCGACDPTEPSDPPSPASPVALNIVTWNVWHGNSKANFEAALQEFENMGIDVVGFQELSSNDKPAALAHNTGCASCYYDAWIPGTPGQGGNVSIIWKKSRFSVVQNASGHKMRYAFKIHGQEPVEDGAGGSVAGTKYLVYVFLKDHLTQRSFWVMNAHALPSVEGACGHPNNNVKRLALYNLMMDTIKEKAKNKAQPIFITGDYNLNYRCDRNVRHFRFPWKKLNSLRPRIRSNWQWHEIAGLPLPTIGTHKPHLGGKRIIDYVFAKADPNVSYQSSKIWKNRRFGSDHAPVRATYMLRQK